MRVTIIVLVLLMLHAIIIVTIVFRPPTSTIRFSSSSLPPPSTAFYPTKRDAEDNKDYDADDNNNNHRLIVQKIWAYIAEDTQPRSAEHNRCNLGKGAGYKNGGGPLPFACMPVFPDPRDWPAMDNGTCLVADDNDGEKKGRNDDDLLFAEQNHRHRHAILLGAMKAGTKALASFLYEHPNVVAPRQRQLLPEIHFFDGKHFVRNASGIPRAVNRRLYASWFAKTTSTSRQIQSPRLHAPATATRKRRGRDRRQYGRSLLLSSTSLRHAVDNDAPFLPSKKNQSEHGLGRQRQEQQRLPPSISSSSSSSSSSSFFLTLDDTPRYLLWSDRVPDAIMCVVAAASSSPDDTDAGTARTKLLAVLRDPVERAISHYNYLNAARRRNAQPMVDWEAWIRHDMDLLRKAGVVQPPQNASSSTSFSSFAGSDAERLAWKTYLRKPHSQQPVGRGLYAIQLEMYYRAMDRADKPRSHLLAVSSEALRNDTRATYDRVLQFLELPPHRLRRNDTQLVVHATQSAAGGVPLPSELRKELEDFFAPYNRRLYDLLGWDPIWER